MVTERRLRAILQEMPVLMDAFDQRDCIVIWNTECERVSGYAAAEIIGNSHAMELLYPDADYRAMMWEEAKRRRDEQYNCIWEMTAKDGSIKTIEWFNVGARLKVPGWQEWSIGIDITERRRLETVLHDATQHEQRRLGAELHDGLGQELAGLSLLATGLAKKRAKNDPELQRELTQLAEIAANAITTCKSIARGLAPVQGSSRGLAEALRGLAADTSARLGTALVGFVDESLASSKLTYEACNHLYRIAQEALSNALQHAGARSVQMRLCIDRKKVSLQIVDDGQGFRVPAASPFGIGIKTMSDRALSIGGRLTIAAMQRGGTRVSCECHNRGAEGSRATTRGDARR